jgi:hypothetical protein
MSQIFTKAELVSYMQGKATSDTLAQSITSAVNQWVETYTHRCWGDTATVADEQYPWNSVVWLRHMDIQSITSVKLGWPGQQQSVVDSSAYYLNPLGRLTFYMFANQNMSRLYNDYLHISYVHGVAAVPDDLKLAAMAIAAGFYNWAANANQQVVAASVGSYRLEYIGAVRAPSGTPNPAVNIAEANWSVIDGYVMRRG